MSNIKLFEDVSIRAKWDEDEDCWYFNVVDVISFLTDSNDPTQYWSTLKTRTFENEGLELSTICRQLKFKAKNGKTYKYDSANNEGIFRIIQSVPSPKAEPFKRWLAKLGKERIEEIESPGKAIDRAKTYYEYKGRNSEWINDRLTGQASRHDLTDYWKESGVKGVEYAILTNQIYTSTFGLTAMQYKEKKGLDKRDSLRDNMNSIELVVVRFAEVTAKEIAENINAKGVDGNKKAIEKSGEIVNKAVKEIESTTGKSVISKDNFKNTDTNETTRHILQAESNHTELPTFDQNLKGLLNTPPPKKNKK